MQQATHSHMQLAHSARSKLIPKPNKANGGGSDLRRELRRGHLQGSFDRAALVRQRPDPTPQLRLQPRNLPCLRLHLRPPRLAGLLPLRARALDRTLQFRHLLRGPRLLRLQLGVLGSDLARLRLDFGVLGLVCLLQRAHCFSELAGTAASVQGTARQARRLVGDCTSATSRESSAT
eukprot:3403237-Rhodomonas_salina.3